MTLGADTSLRAPFPWPGGKRRVGTQVWNYLGPVGRYVEPFAGSLGVLLARPEPYRGVEVVNDLDGYVVNVWRGLKHDPDSVIGWADDVRSEYDLTARHLWLVNEGAARLRAGLQTDPDWFDAQVAGWWLYGVALWIGDAFASGAGPWTAGRIHAVEASRKLPHLGSDGRGVRRKLPHLGSDGRGVHRQLPHLGNDGQGVIQPGVYQLAHQLSRRLQSVVITNGDWARVVSPSALRPPSGAVGVYLDPPYDTHEDAYAETGGVWDSVVDWCETAHSDTRIVLSGYAGARSPRGWREIAYTARGTSSANRSRERFWISDSCQTDQLFDELGKRHESS